MAFIPIEDIQYKTNISPIMVLEILSSNTEKYNILKTIFYSYNKIFIGKFDKNNFKLKYNFNLNKKLFIYYNTFDPIAFGKIFTNNNETIINVFMRMNIFDIIFMSIWLGGFVFGIIYFIFLTQIDYNFERYFAILIIFLVFVIGYIFMTALFKRKSSKIINKLLELLKSEIIYEL
ncbi:MAG: hypothetical protein FWD47_05360 [Treponema sp.]|nr:hypothetical protein [Treponema sp.]